MSNDTNFMQSGNSYLECVLRLVYQNILFMGEFGTKWAKN